MAELSDDLRGDGPCMDCGTKDNIVWFTESVFWNQVMDPSALGIGGIVCIPCFIVRVDRAGFAPTGWRLIPDWHWETHADRETRRFPEVDQ